MLMSMKVLLQVTYYAELLIPYCFNPVLCVHCDLGESVPVTKTPIASHQQGYDEFGQSNSSFVDISFQMNEHSRHVLFCGTHVIQTRYYSKQPVKAVVLRTG
jgi:hypothetical protein